MSLDVAYAPASDPPWCMIQGGVHGRGSVEAFRARLHLLADGAHVAGLGPFLLPLGERHFIRRMDESGVETRSGKRIAWNEFTDVRRVTSTMGGVELANEISLN